jgi:hypothetical protein
MAIERRKSITQKTSNNYPPNAFLRFAFRLPVHLYRWGLGGLFGKRFVLFQHVGRKSGKHYQTVVEIVEIEQVIITLKNF